MQANGCTLRCAACKENNGAGAGGRGRRSAAGGMTERGPAASHVTQDDMQKHPQLREVVGRTEELQASVKAGKWSEAGGTRTHAAHSPCTLEPLYHGVVRCAVPRDSYSLWLSGFGSHQFGGRRRGVRQ